MAIFTRMWSSQSSPSVSEDDYAVVEAELVGGVADRQERRIHAANNAGH